MISYLETKYTNLISYKLQKFKKSGKGYNFRCPYCGDSKKSKTKARGWIFYSKDYHETRYHCFNCSKDLRFDFFLKDQDYNLYAEYLKDKLFDNKQEKVQPLKKVEQKQTVQQKKYSINLKTIYDLKDDHPAKKYVLSRNISEDKTKNLYYSPKFKTWVNSLIPNKFENINNDEPRLIIPLLDENGSLFGFQGRSFKKNDNLKYITLLLDENKPKLYGLNNLNKNKRVYALEGPIDAMFIENAIASAGGKITTNISKANIPKANCVVIYDNEPRSKETVKKMERAIEEGFSICIWPSELKENDVNNMITAGIDAKAVIDSNIYTELQARLRLIEWKKI